MLLRAPRRCPACPACPAAQEKRVRPSRETSATGCRRGAGRTTWRGRAASAAGVRGRGEDGLGGPGLGLPRRPHPGRRGARLEGQLHLQAPARGGLPDALQGVVLQHLPGPPVLQAPGLPVPEEGEARPAGVVGDLHGEGGDPRRGGGQQAQGEVGGEVGAGRAQPRLAPDPAPAGGVGDGRGAGGHGGRRGVGDQAPAGRGGGRHGGAGARGAPSAPAARRPAPPDRTPGAAARPPLPGAARPAPPPAGPAPGGRPAPPRGPGRRRRSGASPASRRG